MFCSEHSWCLLMTNSNNWTARVSSEELSRGDHMVCINKSFLKSYNDWSRPVSSCKTRVLTPCPFRRRWRFHQLCKIPFTHPNVCHAIYMFPERQGLLICEFGTTEQKRGFPCVCSLRWKFAFSSQRNKLWEVQIGYLMWTTAYLKRQAIFVSMGFWYLSRKENKRSFNRNES